MKYIHYVAIFYFNNATGFEGKITLSVKSAFLRDLNKVAIYINKISLRSYLCLEYHKEWAGKTLKWEKHTSVSSLRTANAFPVVASLPPKGEKRRPEMRLLFASYSVS